MAETETAILAGGCFWASRIWSVSSTASSARVLATRVATFQSRPTATTARMPRRSRSCSIRTASRTGTCSSSSSRSTTRRPRTAGYDTGTSYRSAIFYVDDEQRRIAEDTIADVEASGLWPGKVVTEVEPAGPFWEAEPEHQDYLERYPIGYTCHFVRPGWKLPRRAQEAAH